MLEDCGFDHLAQNKKQRGQQVSSKRRYLSNKQTESQPVDTLDSFLIVSKEDVPT